MADITREQLEQNHPLGSVMIQIDDEVRPMNEEEWHAWVERQVGTEKPVSAEGVI